MIELIDFYKIYFFVPETHAESVKKAVFNAGAGSLGGYECCCWQVLGTGQFKPSSTSQPFIGNTGIISEVAEYKIEILCEKDKLESALEALEQAHPYEVPAIDVIPVLIPNSK